MTKADAFKAVQEQRRFMRDCGGGMPTEGGYIRTYGSRHDRKHSGDGGEAIYAADLAHLRDLEKQAGIER
jgi:hypothetical protein